MLRRPCFSTVQPTGGSAGLSSVRSWSLWFENQSNIKESQHWCNFILSGSFPSTIWCILRTAFSFPLTLIQPQGAVWICTKVTEGIWLQGLRVMWLSVHNWCTGLSHRLWTRHVNRHLPLPVLTQLAWWWTWQEGGFRGGVSVTGRWFEQRDLILNSSGTYSL